MPARFRFFSGSKSEPPGLGTGELQDPLEADDALLDGERDWRKAPGGRSQRGKRKREAGDSSADARAALEFVAPPAESLPHRLLRSTDARVLAFIESTRKPDSLLALKPADSHSKFRPLHVLYPDFRRILSNFFLFDMRDPETAITWPSVEHYYHAHKIQLVSSHRSMADIHAQVRALTPAQVKSSTSKKNLAMTPQQLEQWNRHEKMAVIQRGLRLKFLESGQDSIPFKVLVATCDATLQHVSRGIAGDAFSLGRQIMVVRDECCALLS
ncbi:hypothetical protein HK100_008004, partial [Physocladia obscura]